MTRQDNGTAPPRPGSPHQSQRHGATQTRLCPAITTAQRHPDQALPSNHNGTAPPRPGSPQQSQRHSATQTWLSPTITTAQRHPDQALPSNHNGTAPPRPGSPQQSQRHSASQTRLSPANTTAQPRPEQVLPTNPHGTAPQSFAQATPLEANPKGTAHRAQNERARSVANARERSRYHFQNRNEHGPDTRPPRQKQEPFATHSGKIDTVLRRPRNSQPLTTLTSASERCKAPAAVDDSPTCSRSKP